MQPILQMLETVMDRMTVETPIGRILQPGPSYLGIWARDTGIAALGLNRLGRNSLARELLRRYWEYQINESSDASRFVIRNKLGPNWTQSHAFQPSPGRLKQEVGGFPTCVYINTPDFPAGTREIYGRRADIDGTCWLVIAVEDYLRRTSDGDLLADLAPRVARAVDYLFSRDEDGDHLLEQGPNEDWADVLVRRGKVAYTQAVWFKCLEAAEWVFTASGDVRRAHACHREREAVRIAVNQLLLLEDGYYANYATGSASSARRSLDTALLVAFDVADADVAPRVADVLVGLAGPFGPAVVQPGYDPRSIGPAAHPPGQYQNEGVWPWISAYLVLALARVGRSARAEEILRLSLGPNLDTVHEWVDGLNGERYHPDFATGAGALAWAITEGGLDGRGR